ncbi:hypothetical protein DFH06DRAFT_1480806 [Mycena polygramma]|nr:hypothetical protein DFH06DRAFT_1480806 [Mycena polygramma]
MTVALIAANLGTLAVGSLFYGPGMYIILFFISMHLLLRRYNATHTSHKSRPTSSIFASTVFVSAICLFLVVTAVRWVIPSFHWITIVYRCFIAYVALQHGNEAETFFSDHTQLTEVIQNCFMLLSIVIGDSLIIHRLWVVWAHKKLVLVVPVGSLITLTVGSFVSLNITAHSTDIFANPLLKMNAILTLLNNVYCTGKHRLKFRIELKGYCAVFITWKIWKITKASMPSLASGTSLNHFLVIVVESAALYACWAVFFAVTYEVQSNLQSTVIQTAPALVGIVNALIQTRVGLGWTSEQAEGLSCPSLIKFAAGDAV